VSGPLDETPLDEAPLEQPRADERGAHPDAVRQRLGIVRMFDRAFFVFGTVATGWLGYLLVTESFTRGWQNLWFILIFWVVLAYLLLPRIHSLLTVIYVPDYFIGRARTREGLLGDPVNLSLFGSAEQVHTAMQAAGWNRADEVSLTSGWRIVMSTIMRRSYSDAPVSPLYLFGGIQDFTYQQEVAGNPAQRHHVRFWRAPEGWLLPGGIPTQWLAAGTYDRSVGLSLFTLQVTHKIDADTDVERDHIVASVRAANPAATVSVIRNFSTGYHAVNGGGDAIVTDGDLPQLDLRAVPVAPVATPGVAS
jgi:hypothetical protein